MASCRLVLFLVLISACAAYIPDISYHEMTERLQKLNGPYASVATAHKLYHIDDAREREAECSPAVLRVTHVSSSSVLSAAASTHRKDTARPQIFISGEIHGDERIGPSAAMITAELLVKAAECVVDKTTDGAAKACAELRDTYSITDARVLQWLAMLATRRDSIIVPAANCLGHFHHGRQDARVDPNRDFPYGRSNPACLRSTTARIVNAIMRNNLVQMLITFHGGMVAIGYEWGSVNHNKPADRCPDNNVHQIVATNMADFAGEFSTTARKGRALRGDGADSAAVNSTTSRVRIARMLDSAERLNRRRLADKEGYMYPTGAMNSIVYPVEGGMEDWAYAAGWDTAVNTQCSGYTPTAAAHVLRSDRKGAGVPVGTVFSSTVVENDPAAQGGATNRAVVFLVETSDAKKPRETTWGKEANILDTNAAENGHVPRNVRLALQGIDMLQPYVCTESLSVIQGSSASTLALAWSVGGVTTVDMTWISILVNPVMSSATLQHLIADNDYTTLLKHLKKHSPPEGEELFGDEKASSGAAKHTAKHPYLIHLKHTRHLSTQGRWNKGAEAAAYKPLQPVVFSAKFDIVASTDASGVRMDSGHETVSLPPGEHWVIPWATVDANLAQGVKSGSSPQGYPQNMPPQSHLVNARSNPAWFHAHTTRASTKHGEPEGEVHSEVHGYTYWPAEPVVIKVSEAGTTAGRREEATAEESNQPPVATPATSRTKVETIASTLKCAWWEAAGPAAAGAGAGAGSVVARSSLAVDDDIVSAMEKLGVDAAPVVALTGTENAPTAAPADKDGSSASGGKQAAPVPTPHQHKSTSFSDFMFILFYLGLIVGFLYLAWMFVNGTLLNRSTRRFYGSSNSSYIKEITRGGNSNAGRGSGSGSAAGGIAMMLSSVFNSVRGGATDGRPTRAAYERVATAEDGH